MGHILRTLLFAFASALLASLVNGSSPTEKYIFPYPGNCSLFYICSNGEPVVQACPNGTYFNANYSVCDWPDHSGCVQPPRPSNKTVLTCEPPPLPTTSTPAPPAFQCPKVSDPTRFRFPSPDDCSMFYDCASGQPKTMYCPSGLFFNNATQQCDFPSRAKCKVRWTCPQPSWQTMYTYPGDCTRYYVCLNGAQYLWKCNSNLYFNERAQTCDIPSKSGCPYQF